MFDSLLDQIPATVAVGLLVFMVCCNFFFALGKFIINYITKRNEQDNMSRIEQKVDRFSEDLKQELKDINKESMSRVDEIEKVANDAANQVAVMVAHYESELRFREMLEKKVNSIEKQLQGNGKPSISTEIELLKQKLDTLSDDVKSIANKTFK